MRSQRNGLTQQSAAPLWLRLLRHNLPLVIFLILALIGMGTVYLFFGSDGEADLTTAVTNNAPFLDPAASGEPAKPVLQRLTQSSTPIRIGIIAGHQGFDSGAVCADGLTEATVNADLAERLAANLQARGIRAEVLDEFDSRLTGYSATALISIHADSCQYVNELATGYKISSSAAAQSNRLESCMESAYGAATGLTYHANTITLDMTNYHAFYEVSSETPAIIIEVGFMYLDRDLLTTHTDPVVIGLIDGVTCFLESNG